MKKILILGILCIFSFGNLFAGDVATFVDKGFSEDGKYYIFGQYGRTDKKYQGWAEIYQVDIAKNDFVDGGIFRTKPNAQTTDKNGLDIFQQLEAKSYYHFKNIKCNKTEPNQVLYVCEATDKKGVDKIVFKDFGNKALGTENEYTIQLCQTVYGSGKNVKSSFYITVEKKDSKGNVISVTKVGSPDIVRKGVSAYKIEKIMCDKSQKNFIFVVEKTMQDDTGILVRYMVEAAQIK